MCSIYDDYPKPAKTLIWDIQKTSLNFGLLFLSDCISYYKSLLPRAYADKVDLSPLLKREHIRSDERLRSLVSLVFIGEYNTRQPEIAHSVES